MTKRVAMMALGGVLCASAAGWWSAIGPRWTERIPRGWEWKARFVGIQTSPDPETGELPDKDATSLYERLIRIESERERPRAVALEDQYVVRDTATGKPVWEYVYRADVDPETGEHVTPAHRGEYFVFPRHVEKRPYTLRFSYLKGVTVAFEKEERVDDLLTYVFSYRGRGEYTEAYAGTDQYAPQGITVAVGEEIRCADDQFLLRVWVEPVTGEIIKLDESCYSNDYVYEIATGRRLKAVDRWGGTTAGDDVIRRADAARGERLRLLWAERYCPGGLLLAGVGMLAAGTLRVRFPREPAASRA